jgi:hypothetical protein
MVSAGQQCPPGYENVAQVDSTFNASFVMAEGGLPNAGQAAAIPLTITFASGVSSFTGNLPHTTPADHTLAGPQNNSSTYELLVIRNGKRFAYRIPRITFSTAGVVAFSVSADLRFLIDSAPTTCTSYLFQSGLLLRSALNEAGQYSKPFVSDVDIQLSQWSFSDDGAQAPQGLTLSTQDGAAWLDRVLVANAELFTVDDVVSFRDEDGALLTPPAAAAFLSSAGLRNLGALIAGLPFGPSFRVAAVNIDEGFLRLTNLGGSPTDVSGYIIADGSASYDSPPAFNDNFYRIERGSVEHKHLIDVSEDQEVKVYNPGGHWVAKAEHYHAMAAQAVIPPYVKMVLCARL